MSSRKRSLIYCFGFIIAFLCNVAFDLACGPETDPYDYYTSFFTNNVVQPNHDFRSFYYNGINLLNDPDEQVSEADINAGEWARYLGNKVTMKDVRHAMYQLPIKVDSILSLRYLKTGSTLPDSLQKNTFLTSVVSPEHKSALRYYVFSKDVESVANMGVYRPWDPKPMDTVALVKKGVAALKYAATEPDEFIKLRWYYQAQRLLHYGKQYEQAMAVYDQHIASNRSKTHVMGWALALKAGEETNLAEPTRGAYLFCKVFALYPERRVQAYINFNNIKEPVNSVLALTENDREKAFVYALQGFKTAGPDLTALKQVYRYQPQSDLVSVLLLREINKIEEGYLTSKLSAPVYVFSDRPDTTVKKFERMIPALQTFCKQLTTDRKYPEPALGNLASAYLYWIIKDNQKGFEALNAIDAKGISNRLDDERQIVKLLLLAQKEVKLNDLSENELLPSLQWLTQKSKLEYKSMKSVDRDKYWGDYDLRKISAAARDFYAQILMPMYLKQRDTAMAALSILKSERVLTITNRGYGNIGLGSEMPVFWQTQLRSSHLRTILNWQKQRAAKPYLNLMMADVDKRTEMDIYDLLGTAYLREMNYAEAVNAFKSVDAKKLSKTLNTDDADNMIYADPFTSQLKDYPKVYNKDKTKSFTKLTFAQAMLALQQQIKASPQNAAAYYKMATGLYNTSTYGNSWNMISYQWSSYDYESKPSNYYDIDFLKTARAERYYLRARDLSKDPEFKARCTFMAAKCHQKQIPFPEDRYDFKHYAQFEAKVKAYHLKVRQNYYFDQLRQNYKGTAFFKRAVSECSYLKDFIVAAERVGKKK